jgi:endothelin-converting enzyme/putative endopeptidase
MVTMHKIIHLLALPVLALLFGSGFCVGQTTAIAPAAAETPLTALPDTPGLDVSAMDKNADACVDF